MSEVVLRVEQTRGGVFETVHPVSAVVVDQSGQVQQRFGPELVTTWRSAAKPFQLVASLSRLPVAVTHALTAPELALGAASHSAESAHIAGVNALFDRLDRSVGELRCGAHAPMSEAANAALIRAGQAAEPIHNNCSGKHAFMVAASEAGSNYLAPKHSLQRRIAEVIEEHTGASVVAETAVDGCGVPCFTLELGAMARAWARLAADFQAPTPLGRVARAMSEHSWLMSGTGRLDHRLVTSASKPIVTKVGAAGLLCVALPHRALGIAIKVHTGDPSARALAAWDLLRRLDPDLLAETSDWRVITTVVGGSVGERRVVWPDG